MKAARFDYQRAPDLAGALALLAADAGGSTRALAGGQSLGPMLNLRLARPARLIDLGAISALREISGDGERWRIGAGVTHARIEDASEPLDGRGYLRHVASGIAYRAVRNRGTIGGSLAHADPAADWPLALAAIDARVCIAGPRGSRQVGADGFMRAGFSTVLADDELIEAIEGPVLGTQARWGYFKICRKTGEFPEASAAAVFDPERRVARIVAGALAGAPVLLAGLAAACARQGEIALTRAAVDQALVDAGLALDAVERRLHATAILRATAQVFAR
jgi:carbon-monoxide dehydrogenase medium subunit